MNLSRNKEITIKVVEGALLKVMALDHNISIERVRQLTQCTLKSAFNDSSYDKDYRNYSPSDIKLAVSKIQALKN